MLKIWILFKQDIEDLNQLSWDDKLDNNSDRLTELGYKELVQLAHRIKIKYATLLSSVNKDGFYFRPTLEQRTVMSAKAFVEGLSPDGELKVDSPVEADEVIRVSNICIFKILLALFHRRISIEEYNANGILFRDIFPDNSIFRSVIRFKKTKEYSKGAIQLQSICAYLANFGYIVPFMWMCVYN